jgi:hypothetical protein
MSGMKADTWYAVKVVLGAAGALLVLAARLVHPAMAGEAEAVGRWLVCLLTIAVVCAAALALLMPRAVSNAKAISNAKAARRNHPPGGRRTDRDGTTITARTARTAGRRTQFTLDGRAARMPSSS